MRWAIDNFELCPETMGVLCRLLLQPFSVARSTYWTNSFDDFCHWRGKLELLWFNYPAGDNFLVDLDRLVGKERRVAGCHLIHQHPESPPVHCFVVTLGKVRIIICGRSREGGLCLSWELAGEIGKASVNRSRLRCLPATVVQEQVQDAVAYLAQDDLWCKVLWCST